MSFQLSILGSNAAVPAHGRNMTAQLLRIRDHWFLIDCAEATQHQFQRFGFKSQKINHIFISHLHGDHIFGLPGFLLSMSMNNRKECMHIFSPPGLQNYLDTSFSISQSHLSFEIIFHETDPQKGGLIFENESLTVSGFPLLHRIPTQGFIFKEKPLPRKILKEKISQYAIPFQDIVKIKNGSDWVDSTGKFVSNSELTVAPKEPRTYAYCSDTALYEQIIPMVAGADLLYHEATYMHDLQEQALFSGHSTAFQAAGIAKKAGVKKLIIGHFSSRYANPQCLLDEAKLLFQNTELALDGQVFSID
jgi:ribonuclease Z